MILTLALSLVLLQGQVVTQGGPPPPPVPKNAPAELPDTPQGRHVQAYIDAFNSGDEANFLKAQEALMAPDVLAKRPADQRAKMFARIRGDFGTLVVKRAVATADTIRAVMLNKEGDEAIFSFEFDSKAPFKIKSIGVDIGRVER